MLKGKLSSDRERVERNREALRNAGLDLFLCALPINVLLLSGYWPVIGNAIAVFTAHGEVELIVPKDEKRFAENSWASNITTFSTGSLERLESLVESIWNPLCATLSRLASGAARIGTEGRPSHVPASYAAMNVYSEALPEMLRSMLPRASHFIADDHLARLRSTLTAAEVSKVRTACAIAAEAFEEGRRQLQPGPTERETAVAFRRRLSAPGTEYRDLLRADGFTYCMSGVNSYRAASAYQHSSGRRLEQSDIVLVHCNSYADGFWTDITRTYLLGQPDETERKILDTIFAARKAALDAIKPGVRAADVDGAARSVMGANGFGDEFKHGLGHAVGFHAIDHNAQPRLHPASPDVLETGMVFNVEPAVYIKDRGGFRHCDMVAVTETGSEVLTDFQASADAMLIETESAGARTSTSGNA